MDTANKIRYFISLNIPQDVIEYANQTQRNIQKVGYVAAKYTKPTNLHLTLKFLGEISNTRVESVIDRLSEIPFNPVIIKIQDLGVFSRRQVRII